MTFPTIPDNYYKFSLYLGLIIIGYCFLNSIEIQKTYNTKVDLSNSYIDSLKIKKIYQERKKQLLIDISKDLSKKYNIENPIETTDSTASFNYLLKGAKEEIIVSDSIKKLWDKYTNGNFEIDVLNTKIEMKQKNLKIDKIIFDKQMYLYLVAAVFGLFIVLIGI